MTILNFPDNPAAVDNIYVAPNGVTYLYDGVKWSGQTLVGNTPVIDLGAVEQDIIPSINNTYDLGSPSKTWKHIYAASGSIYLGDIKLTNDDGTFVATQVTNPGAVNEAPVGPTGNSLSIPTDISDLTDNEKQTIRTINITPNGANNKYYQKYLKYKNKYLTLKQNII